MSKQRVSMIGRTGNRTFAYLFDSEQGVELEADILADGRVVGHWETPPKNPSGEGHIQQLALKQRAPGVTKPAKRPGCKFSICQDKLSEALREISPDQADEFDQLVRDGDKARAVDVIQELIAEGARSFSGRSPSSD